MLIIRHNMKQLSEQLSDALSHIILSVCVCRECIRNVVKADESNCLFEWMRDRERELESGECVNDCQAANAISLFRRSPSALRFSKTPTIWRLPARASMRAGARIRCGESGKVFGWFDRQYYPTCLPAAIVNTRPPHPINFHIAIYNSTWNSVRRRLRRRRSETSLEPDLMLCLGLPTHTNTKTHTHTQTYSALSEEIHASKRPARPSVIPTHSRQRRAAVLYVSFVFAGGMFEGLVKNTPFTLRTIIGL